MGTVFLVLLGLKRNTLDRQRSPASGNQTLPPSLSVGRLPLWIEIHDAHDQDLLPRPHSSFDVPTEWDCLEKDGRDSQ